MTQFKWNLCSTDGHWVPSTPMNCEVHLKMSGFCFPKELSETQNSNCWLPGVSRGNSLKSRWSKAWRTFSRLVSFRVMLPWQDRTESQQSQRPASEPALTFQTLRRNQGEKFLQAWPQQRESELQIGPKTLKPWTGSAPSGHEARNAHGISSSKDWCPWETSQT